MQKAEKNGIVYTYTYDHNGFLSKCSASLDTITYTLEYLWDDAQLLSMYFTITSGEETNSAKIQMLYDSDSNLVGYIYDGIGIMLFADNLIGEGSKMIDVVSGDMIEGIKYDAFGGGAPTGFDEATDSQSATASQAVTDPIMNIMLQNATTAEIAAASTQSVESTLSTNSENENTSTNNNLGETLTFIATLIGGLMYSGSYKGYALVPTADGFFYTLGTRMYSPVLGRFMSADIHTDTQQGAVGTNMFAYCNNSPTLYVDPLGDAPQILNIFSLFSILTKTIILLKCGTLLIREKVLRLSDLATPVYKLVKADVDTKKGKIIIEIQNRGLRGNSKIQAIFGRFKIIEWITILSKSFLESIDPSGNLQNIWDDLDIAWSVLGDLLDGTPLMAYQIIELLDAISSIADNQRITNDLNVLQQKAKAEGMDIEKKQYRNEYLTILVVVSRLNKYGGQWYETQEKNTFKGGVWY